jgi:hypothetical protein
MSLSRITVEPPREERALEEDDVEVCKLEAISNSVDLRDQTIGPSPLGLPDARELALQSRWEKR